MGRTWRRRVFLLGSIASAAAVAIVAAGIRWRPERAIMRYEDGLEAQFKNGDARLTLLTLSHLAGFSPRVPEWLSLAPLTVPEAARDLQALFESLLSGEIGGIEAALRAAHPRSLGFTVSLSLEKVDRTSPAWLDEALAEVVQPLTLLGRGDLIVALHARSLQRLRPRQSSLTSTAALTLAQAADWPHVMEILEEARRMGGNLDLAHGYEELFWQYAYLHDETERAMPVIAQARLRPDLPHLVEYSTWKLKAYQIRAGNRDVDVPIIETNRPHGYADAAAMQLAALEDDPAAAELVESLRRVLQPQSVEMIHANRGFAATYDMVEHAVSKARAGIAARRKDYGRAAELARAPLRNMIDPAHDVVNALLSEGDWRAAADIARTHDPRRKKVPPGFDDTRISDYRDLFIRLALAAAWSGDDRAAAEFVDAAEQAERTNPDKHPGNDIDRFSWVRTVLAGAAEGLLPRRYINMLTHGFLSPF